ncbi:MAG: TrmB family transcriptional regulator [Desulfobacterales bacterium]|nr:TrmB family transcriptional regulator [Desulfobacterales bacterium]
MFNFGFSQYETTAYLTLLSHHPINGSRLSRHSGIPRARIYDVLRGLKAKGVVVALDKGRFAPLPPEETLKRFRHLFDTELDALEKRFKSAAVSTEYEYVWTIEGYNDVMAKAREMAVSSRFEIYIRLYPREAKLLDQALQEAAERGVKVKYISMGPPLSTFDLQVAHPGADAVEERAGGRSFDIVVDKQEILVGLFEKDREDDSPINWAKNHWFVVAARDSLRHDFFHYFLHKTYDLGETLTGREAAIYELIKADD